MKKRHRFQVIARSFHFKRLPTKIVMFPVSYVYPILNFPDIYTIEWKAYSVKGLSLDSLRQFEFNGKRLSIDCSY